MAVVLGLSAATACAQTVAYTGSVQYSTGEYIFAERTHSVYVASGVDVSTDRVSVSASLPLIVQDSPWISYTGLGAVPSGGPQHGAVRRRGSGRRHGDPIVLSDTSSYNEVGLGDPVLSASVQVSRRPVAGWTLRVSSFVKPPVADVDRGFGTGAWDLGVGFSLSHPSGSWFWSGDATYWRTGDGGTISLRDPVALSLSVGQLVRDGTVGLLATVAGSTELVDGAGVPLQIRAAATYLWRSGHSLGVTGAVGLTDAAPEAGGGLQWRVQL